MHIFSSNHGTHAITGTPNIVDWYETNKKLKLEIRIKNFANK